MRWGKATKNTRRRDPRYFLNEDMQPQGQETEEQFLKRWEAALNDLSDEELLQDFLSEIEEPEAPLINKPPKEQLYLSAETEKYMINFARRRVMQVASILARKILFTASVASHGALPAIALPVMAALGITPKKVWRSTSTTGIDNALKKFLQDNMKSTADALYPGDTNLRRIAKAAVQEVIRSFKKSGQEAQQKIEALPEPERKEVQSEISQQLEALKKEMQNESVPS